MNLLTLMPGWPVTFRTCVDFFEEGFVSQSQAFDSRLLASPGARNRKQALNAVSNSAAPNHVTFLGYGLGGELFCGDLLGCGQGIGVQLITNGRRSAGLPGCVVCQSNHGITLPTDAKLGSGPQGVCMQCHTPGDVCDQARAKMLADLTRLDATIKGADKILTVAESSGMEVSDARLEQNQARDSLTKARVTIHTFQTDLVEKDIQSGLQIAAKDLQAGKAALVERDYRRKGLGLALIFILMSVVGLYLYIRQIERNGAAKN